MNEQVKTAGETAMQVFAYEGNPITFKVGETLMVNATQMAKCLNKRAVDWLRLPTTKDFLDNLYTIRCGQDPGVQKLHFEVQRVTDEGLKHILNCFKDAHATNVIAKYLAVTVRGGNPRNQGTWFHEDVAMEFARWLSPKFAIWTNDRIKELVTRGHTETEGFRLEPTAATVENFGKFAEKMHDRLIGIWREIAKLQMAQEAQNEATLKIAESIRKSLPAQPDTTPEDAQDEGPDFPRTASNHRSEDGNYTLSETAKILGFRNGLAFVNWAREHGVLGCDGVNDYSRWYPHSPYKRRGFFAFRPSTRPGSVDHYLVVTPKGVDMLRWELYGNSPL